MSAAPSTDLVPVADAAAKAEIVRALAGGESVESIIERLAKPEQPAAVEARAKVPPLVPLKPAQLAALDALIDVYGKVHPAEARELSGEERVTLLAERDAVSALAALKSRVETIREILANDLDRIAERTGQAFAEARNGHPATPRSDSGHYLLEGEVSVPGTGRKVTRTLRGGKVSITDAALRAAYDAGHLTRKQYLAVTVERRVFDPAKLPAAVVADPALAQILAEHATVTEPKTAVVQPQPDRTQG
jgi:hypothetical protein